MLPEVAVTGAGGYVGSALTRALERRGVVVRRLQRSGDGDRVRPFVLGAPVDPAAMQGAQALVHCAWDFGAAGRSEIERTNVAGSLALFEAARTAGVRRIVFISTMSAFDGCRSLYGRAKLEVERGAAPSGTVVVRPGLVYGAASGGMVGALGQLLRLPLVTPLVGTGSQRLYMVHEDDLGDIIAEYALGERTAPAGPVIAASARPFTFREIVSLLARRDGLRRVLLPVPWQAEWLALKGAELAGMRMRLRSDSLISLINQDPRPDFTASAGIGFRDFETFTLGSSGRRALV